MSADGATGACPDPARCGRSLRAPLGLKLANPRGFSIARSRQAVPLAGAEMGRSSLRSDFPPLLALRAHGKTRYVRCAHFAQTVAVSQRWMRAGARRPQDCAARRPMTAPARGTACRSNTTVAFGPRTDPGCSKGCAGGGWRACEAPRSAGFVARARQRASTSDSRHLLERSERSERSELCRGATDPSTAGQSERSEDRFSRPPAPTRTALCRAMLRARGFDGLSPNGVFSERPQRVAMQSYP